MRRPLLIGLIAGGVLLLAAIVIGAVVLVLSTDRQNALDAHAEAAGGLTADVATAEAVIAQADAVLVHLDDPLVPEEPMARLGGEREDAAAEIETAADLLAIDADDLGTEEVRQATLALDAASRDLAEIGILDALAAVRDSVVESATAVGAANVEAENSPHIAFRDAVDGMRRVAESDLAAALATYVEAARALESSNAEELAEKAGPLFEARLTVQAFARELARGVLLDFDWARLVNGYGTGGSYGGMSSWNSASDGYATITLSDSVAAMWPGAGVQALVAHEVGHAILARIDCNTMFFDSEFAAGGEEQWATAWAIGLGHTANGSGESLYGRPPDALIALSTECR